jgi:hypothetical protein
VPPSPEQLLEFLFTTIVRKLQPMSLREGAAVARYLHSLAWDPAHPEYRVRGDDLQLLHKLSDVIWGTVLQRAPFKAANKKQAIEFLEKNAYTHLVRQNVAGALDLVRALPEPKPHVAPPTLSGRFTGGALGAHRARLNDDLTERISAGYWALRQANVAKASTRVAEAVNRYGLRTRSRRSDTRWSSYEVQERVKQYDRVLSKHNAGVKTARQQLVERWEIAWYSATTAPITTT